MRKHIMTLKSDLLNKVVTEYIDYITNPLHPYRQEANYSIKVIGTNEPKPPKPMPLKTDKYTGATKRYNLARPKPETARKKIQMIVDILYRAYQKSENGLFTVKSTTLKKVTQNYKYILDVLIHFLIINKTPTYTDDNNYDSTLYQLNDIRQFHWIETPRSVRSELARFERWEDELQAQRTQKIISATSEHFVEKYNQSLRQLKINQEAALSYISEQYDTDTHEAQSRIYTVNKISQKHHMCLTTIDDNGRLYHIGTQLQRDLKRYTNIHYTIDCKNSHPYLLTTIIIRYLLEGTLSITNTNWSDNALRTIQYNLTRYLLDNNGRFVPYEFSNYISNCLKNSDLRKNEIAKVMSLTKCFDKVKQDVWLYIYDAASGKVWDYLVKRFNEERSTVKKEMFGSVVYSYTKRRNKKNEETNKWLKAFVDRYPTVYDIIVRIKRSIHKQCVEQGRVDELPKSKVVRYQDFTIEIKTKDRVLLPMIMMQLESAIFTEVLTRLFKKRITCFGIHDAVAVINPKKMSVDDIKNVILDVYKLYGMIPTLSIDYYSEG